MLAESHAPDSGQTSCTQLQEETYNAAEAGTEELPDRSVAIDPMAVLEGSTERRVRTLSAAEEVVALQQHAAARGAAGNDIKLNTAAKRAMRVRRSADRAAEQRCGPGTCVSPATQRGSFALGEHGACTSHRFLQRSNLIRNTQQ